VSVLALASLALQPLSASEADQLLPAGAQLVQIEATDEMGTIIPARPGHTLALAFESGLWTGAPTDPFRSPDIDGSGIQLLAFTDGQVSVLLENPRGTATTPAMVELPQHFDEIRLRFHDFPDRYANNSGQARYRIGYRYRIDTPLRDHGYASDGVARLTDHPGTLFSARPLPDRRLMLGGWYAETLGGFVTRLTADGQVDRTFAADGIFHVSDDFAQQGRGTAPEHIQALGDGSLLVSVWRNTFAGPFGAPWLVHLDADGQVRHEAQLGPLGFDDVRYTAALGDGSALVVGSGAAGPLLTRYAADGSLAFNGQSVLVVDAALEGFQVTDAAPYIDEGGTPWYLIACFHDDGRATVLKVDDQGVADPDFTPPALYGPTDGIDIRDGSDLVVLDYAGAALLDCETGALQAQSVFATPGPHYHAVLHDAGSAWVSGDPWPNLVQVADGRQDTRQAISQALWPDPPGPGFGFGIHDPSSGRFYAVGYSLGVPTVMAYRPRGQQRQIRIAVDGVPATQAVSLLRSAVFPWDGGSAVDLSDEVEPTEVTPIDHRRNQAIGFEIRPADDG
jgi:hypothetical protein